MELTEESLGKILPHGSGINCDWVIEERGSYFRCKNSFFCIDENGGNDGYAEFILFIRKDSPCDFNLHFRGSVSERLNLRYGLREYLEDTIRHRISENKMIFVETAISTNPADMSRPDFLKWAEVVIRKKPEPKSIGITLKRDFDLRASLEQKSFAASDLARWTAFVNVAGTLCHVVCPVADILIRVKFGYPIKHLNEWQMLQAVEKRVGDYIRID